MIYQFTVMLMLNGIALAGDASKSSPLLLQALSECPEKEPTCVVFDANLSWPGKRSDNAIDHPSVVSIDIDNNTGYGTAVVEVRGRLNSGPEKKFRVIFPYPMDQLGCVDFSAAVIGVSGEMGGTVLTDAGRLEVTDEALRFGSLGSLSLIEDETFLVTRHHSSGWEKYSWKEKPVISPEGRVMWEVQGQCLDYESGKLFQTVPKGECRGNELVHATKAEIERVRKGNVFKDAYDNERLKYDLWRLMDAPYLVRIWGVACT